MATKVEHDVVNGVQVLILTTYVRDKKFLVEAKWGPAELSTPTRYKFEVTNCQGGHRRAAEIGFDVVSRRITAPPHF